MESVWWVFKTLVEKGLVYRGYKVMPFSTACATPLSNFEAGLNYKDVADPAVVVAFPLKDDAEVCLPLCVSDICAEAQLFMSGLSSNLGFTFLVSRR